MKYLFILFILVGCTAPISQNKQVSITDSQKEWGYKLHETISDSASYSGDLILQSRMCEKQFRELLADVRRDEFEDYEKVMLDVYLDSLSAQSYWAFVRVNPNMNYTIYGITLDQIKELHNYSFDVKGVDTIIGEWLYQQTIRTIYKKEGNLILHSVQLSDDAPNDYDAIELKESDGKLVDVDPEFHDEYFEVLKNGKLRCYFEDSDGKVEDLDIESLDTFLKNNRSYVSCSK